MQNNVPNPNETYFRIAAWTAGVAGVLAIVICALLAYDYSRRTAKDPLESANFKAFRNMLLQRPTNEELKEQIRILDTELRREYFRQRAFAAGGAALLLIGMGVFLAACKTAVTLHRRLPQLQPLLTLEDTETKWTRRALWGVAGLFGVLAASVLTLNFASRSPLPGSTEELAAMLDESKNPIDAGRKGENRSPENLAGGANQPGSKNTAAEPPPSDEEIALAWPTFRGPGGRGVSAFKNIPTEWNALEGSEKNLRWKTAVPLPGNSSPVVWKDRVFLSGGDENRREVYCFDAKTGKLLWQKAVPATPLGGKKFERPPDAGYAAPTVATDGRRVFAIFANGDLAGFDVNGNPAWSKGLGIPDSTYGYSSSLTMCKNLLYVQFDQGAEGDAKSKLYAFDSATGNIVWQAKREVPASWASPIAIRAAGRDQIVTAASPWVIAYDPQDGKEIWRADCLRGEIGASPTFAAGKFFTANDGAELSAIPADGQGEVTKKIIWKGEDGIPDTCCPLANEQFVLLFDASNTLTCYDTESGEKLWEESFDEGGYSSPSFVGIRVFLFAKNGLGWVVEPKKDKCERIAENQLGEECLTSPAFQDGCFYIRGKDHLFCIGK
ncbi:MAG: PQQ-binding-like beta-propeller repeat protein [Pirellulales bacterium]|nr:PQQ-binding-like beta-propeller repeat protein [Pirellulales bacterium]